MENSVHDNNNLLIKLSNLAIRIEGKGQYNIAKYVRATIDALLRESAFKLAYDTSDEKLLLDFKNAIEELEALNFDTGIVQKLQDGKKVISQNEIGKISEFPEPMVCRRCGFITNLSEKAKEDHCKRCGADIDTFVIHYPILLDAAI